MIKQINILSIDEIPLINKRIINIYESNSTGTYIPYELDSSNILNDIVDEWILNKYPELDKTQFLIEI